MSKEIRQPQHGEILGQLCEQAELEITWDSPDHCLSNSQAWQLVKADISFFIGMKLNFLMCVSC